MKKVFLGGTCNESTWRERLIPMLEIDYFDPVVDDWNEEAQQQELREREECDFCLYVITPLMLGSYSIAEAVDDSNKRPYKTVFCVLGEDEGKRFDIGQLKSLIQVAKLIKGNRSVFFDNLIDIAIYLNSFSQIA